MEKITDVTAETIELLPARHTLGLTSFHLGNNFALVLAANSSTAVNDTSALAAALSAASQTVTVSQS
ncbi:hypothetical protein [Sinomonas sp. R1AF57]|jgi:hypothetical protein|uniref:hypothetical protein n=1 Tax=Sinomonas sp. R1AF57 TaxID=2020377 RepID=UPI000B5E6083|nr:hypothetical protein [Sinomonas sp. R1AF57]ASN51352.1 hypothetical protein CGQ25_04045 [Sinomonas sp. R1AF57]